MQVLETTKVNTNNGWGFGGWSGTIKRYDNGITFEDGRNSFRHTGTSPHKKVYIPIDEDFSIELTDGEGYISSTLPTADVYVYCYAERFRAMVGECTNLDKLFGYSNDAKLFKIVKV
jgi:hypothetical protein